jgi:hypothetical protein
MRILNNYIFFFLIFLSLFGLGNDQSISRTNVKYLKETEWIAQPSSNSKASKCFYFHLVRFVVSSNQTVQLWEKEFRNSYNRKLIVLFLLQTRLYRNIDIINLISSKIYYPSLFTDDHHVSYRRAELIKHFCSESGIPHQVGNFMWNHLLNREWINQERKINAKGKDVLDGCLIGFL